MRSGAMAYTAASCRTIQNSFCLCGKFYDHDHTTFHRVQNMVLYVKSPAKWRVPVPGSVTLLPGSVWPRGPIGRT